MQLCEYGCGGEAKYQFKNGKWCCSNHYIKCPSHRKKNSIQMKNLHSDPESKFNSESYREKRSNVMKNFYKDPYSKYNSISCKEKQSKGLKEARKDPNSKYNLEPYKKKISNWLKEAWRDSDSGFGLIKQTIENINIKHPFFSKIEEMRYNPNKPLEEKEIQIHCKNHNCKNSKEKGGWFTPNGIQLYERIRSLEKPKGFGESHFYCSQKCKDTCPLYGIQSDPFKNNNLPYTHQENQLWRQIVLELDKGLCQYCGKPAMDVHHIKPVKTHPHLALDPDNGISFCEECHYKIGHKTGTECSTGNLANKQQQGCVLGGQQVKEMK